LHKPAGSGGEIYVNSRIIRTNERIDVRRRVYELC
jgi:hypothetical protein